MKKILIILISLLIIPSFVGAEDMETRNSHYQPEQLNVALDSIEKIVDQIRFSTCPSPGGAEPLYTSDGVPQLNRIKNKLYQIKSFLPRIAKGEYPMNLFWLNNVNPTKYSQDRHNKLWHNGLDCKEKVYDETNPQ